MDIRLAYGGPPESLAAGLAKNQQAERDPALLVSYAYLDKFLEQKHRYTYRDWVLDSGAYTAYASGKEIDLDKYIETCKRLMAEDKTLVEIYSLDVIGDWKASIRNTEKMWANGIPAIPCYHVNEPEHVLKMLATEYPKIALGGVALARTGKKLEWAKQCFARIWPKPIHGFAFCSRRAVMGLPWHSVDASSWELSPCKYGHWRAYSGKTLSIRGSRQNLRVEVDWYLKLERDARVRWRREMEQLDLQPVDRLVDIRLSEIGTGRFFGAERDTVEARK